MERLFQQLADQAVRTNDLLENQQKEMAAMSRRMQRMEDLMLQMAEVLDRDLLSLLDQPLLFKQDVMAKLGISDATFRNYVADEKLDPMKLGKTEYFFVRDLAKQLLKTKKGHQ